MPPKSSSPAKLSTPRRRRRSPSPVIVPSRWEDVLEDEVESDALTPEGQPPPPTTASDDEDGLNSDGEIVEISRLVGKKRAAPKAESDSDVEILSGKVGKKVKSGVGREDSLLAVLDNALKPEKRLRRATEKAKAADTSTKSPAKKAVIPVAKTSEVVADDTAGVVRSSAVQQVKSGSQAVSSLSEDLQERGILPKCTFVPFSSNAKASEDESMMDLLVFLRTLVTRDERRLVATGLRFVSHAPFINPTWASPDLVAVEKDHLVWAESRANAVFFTMGCVSACNLINPAPGINNGAAVKKLLLFPIEGVFQDALDFFGAAFKISEAAGQLSNGVVAFSTKKEGQVVYSSSSGVMGSPKKKGLFKKPSSRPAAASGGFPVALSFGDDVPIYDATDGFKFTESDLSSVRSLPLYCKGTRDLPPYAVVNVGYTATSFITSNSASANTALLFNVLFVLLLAEHIKDDEEQ